MVELAQIKEKKKKFGTKNVPDKETKKEKAVNDEKLKRRLEIAEIKGNLWKNYREKDGKLVQPEVRKKQRREDLKKKKLEEEKLEGERMKNKEDFYYELKNYFIEEKKKKSSTEEDLKKENLELMLLCMEDIERAVEEDFKDDEEYLDDETEKLNLVS